MKRLAVLAIALSVVLGLGASAPPKTEAKKVTDDYHGTEVVDQYRWLEGSDAPEIEEDPALDERVSGWMDEQNVYTRGVLDNLPGREKLEARLRELMEVGSVSTPSVRLNRYFFQKREGDQAQFIVYMQEGVDGEPRVILDPNGLDEEHLIAVSWTTANHDGTLLAFGLYRAGDENSTLHILNVDSGDWLAEEIPGKVSSVDWLPDSSGFFYRRLADLENPYSGQIKFHKLGTHHRQDPILFEQYKEGPLATTWGPYAYTSRDARWMILMYFTGTDSNDLWVIDLDRYFRNGEFEPVTIVEGEKASFSGPIVGDKLLMSTTLDAPNGKVIAVDLNRPGREHWETLIPEKEDAVLEDVQVARSFLIAEYLKNAASQLELLDMNGKLVRQVELPGVGSAGFNASEDRNEAFMVFTSFNEPRSIYWVDLENEKQELWQRPDVPVDPSIVEVKQVFFESKDGTKVPMFLVHKKGLKLDGTNPTMLTGYGGFNISRTPSFSATLFPWFESGGVYALANLRGGGEYGEEWHRAGMLEKKQNVFDDFIAAGEWLVENKYTSSEKLAITGGSNGGLLTGAALVQRPDLFGAVVIRVPLLDMLRYQNFSMARYWVPEYGTSENPEHFEFLRAYSPYQNVKKEVSYPAVMLTAGENDTRVHALHAMKMAALLQASTSSDPEEDPVLLWVDRSGGHGRGKPLDLRVREVADRRIFLRWQLGMLEYTEPRDMAASGGSR